jgi:hypothetical protein
MAIEAELQTKDGFAQFAYLDCLQSFESLVRADERNRLAKECALLPFGDTAASFAVWIKNGGNT